MRLVFMGTPDFAVPALSALLAAGHGIAAVYSQPPRAAGRGMAERKSPVHRAAEAQGLEVRTPVSFKAGEERGAFAALAAEAAVVVAYGMILPQAVLDAPRLGCFNIHASLLPRWRGAAPIQRAIMAGDTETGVSIIRMEAGLDTGPVCRAARVPILPVTTAGALHDTLAALGARLMAETLTLTTQCTEQPAEGATYARKIANAETRIAFDRPAGDVRNQVHGLSPFPGAWFSLRGARIKVLRAMAVKGEGAPGTVLDGAPSIACALGAVRLLEVQREGKAPMTADAFLRGFPVPVGTAADP